MNIGIGGAACWHGSRARPPRSWLLGCGRAVVIAGTYNPLKGYTQRRGQLVGVGRHRFVTFDGLELFYREAGPLDAPTVLLLHGFPSSSIQFRHLLATLSDGWHLVAPDLPGFGLSAVPNHKRYEYSFGNLATTIEHFLQAVQLEPRALYLHDYGAQTGFRLLTRDVVRPHALIIQDSEAYYADGRTEAWETVDTYGVTLPAPTARRCVPRC
jgi:pimeloyl-ACP methyl ester carboxylesterase